MSLYLVSWCRPKTFGCGACCRSLHIGMVPQGPIVRRQIRRALAHSVGEIWARSSRQGHRALRCHSEHYAGCRSKSVGEESIR